MATTDAQRPSTLTTTQLAKLHGFYEWQKTPEGKIPYSIEMKDGSTFVFAGLWDGWQNPHTKEWLRRN